MKKTIIILMAILAIACNKSNLQGYRVTNLSGVDLFVVTPENTYQIQTTKTLFFTSETDNLSYRLESDDLKVLVWELGTSPERTMTVSSYKHNFEVLVTGAAEFVEISINGQYYNEPLPFYYGTDDKPSSYNIYSTPNKLDGSTYTTVYVDGVAVEMFQHYGSGNLSGNID